MELKQCSKCKLTKPFNEFNTRPDRPSGYRSECKKCQYAAHYKREKGNREKVNAKYAARLATKKGKLQKPLFCERCGEDKPLERHHPDYKQPLKVVWVCHNCHSQIHRSLKIA